MKKITSIFLLLFISISLFSVKLRENVIIKNNIFTISYNEIYEQPNWAIYIVRNLPKNVNRGNMDFYTIDSIHTSDSKDYIKNIYDKGHLAPAADFSYNYDALYKTFSFVNCALQNQYLNRGAWKDLENQERTWASEYDSIEVKIILDFKPSHIVLSTNAHVPDGFWKYINFYNGTKKCYYFPNKNPTMPWYKYEINCK